MAARGDEVAPAVEREQVDRHGLRGPGLATAHGEDPRAHQAHSVIGQPADDLHERDVAAGGLDVAGGGGGLLGHVVLLDTDLESTALACCRVCAWPAAEVKSSALEFVADFRHDRGGARPTPRRRHPAGARDRPAAPGRVRRGRAVVASRHPRPRDGVVGGLPLRREPRRAAHPARRRRLHRARRRGRRAAGRAAAGLLGRSHPRGMRDRARVGAARTRALRPPVRQPGSGVRGPRRADDRAGHPGDPDARRAGRRGGSRR